jgi:hypothetical protein
VATLAVRPLSPRDLPTLRHVRQYHERLDVPFGSESVLPEAAYHVLAALPISMHGDRVYVASIDGEVCASVMLRPQEYQYRWDVVSLAAGSPRLEANDDVCVELWTALLEFAIREAGETGAKRLFATAKEDCAAYDSLIACVFDPYTRFDVLAGFLPASPMPLPAGMREQEPSDVWSIHQLYHHVTPHAVQFAEALTSTEWELEELSLLQRYAGRHPRAVAYVLETTHGIEAYCRFVRLGDAPVVTILVHRDSSVSVFQFVAAAASAAGLGRDVMLRVVVPAYASELAREFEEQGFFTESERVALVRHTTSRVAARARVSPVAVEGVERVPRGVPTYYRSSRTLPSM